MDERKIAAFRVEHGADVSQTELESLPCYEIATRYQSPMRLWGQPVPKYVAVKIGGCAVS